VVLYLCVFILFLERAFAGASIQSERL
jgi:hypothetical protein